MPGPVSWAVPDPGLSPLWLALHGTPAPGPARRFCHRSAAALLSLQPEGGRGARPGRYHRLPEPFITRQLEAWSAAGSWINIWIMCRQRVWLPAQHQQRVPGEAWHEPLHRGRGGGTGQWGPLNGQHALGRLPAGGPGLCCHTEDGHLNPPLLGTDTHVLQGVLVGGRQGRKLGLRVVGREPLPQRPELSGARLLGARRGG